MSILRADILAKIPADILLKALDDNHDGIEDAGLLDAVIANAVREAGTNDAAALILACSDLYVRARIDPDKNPFLDAAKKLREGSGAAGTGLTTAASGGTEYTVPDEKHSMEDLDRL